ncbi:MAG: Sjogren's syndrome/scleroderma autoantigen 1 family protein [Halodesulfurarchaeum sp.]
MTEDFDKEAERRRLREKYEADREDRQVTERMSELLLQGATMTNTHCDQCGTPIFRYQGQAFCPTCQAARGNQAEQAGQAGEEPQEAQRAEEAQEAGGNQTRREAGDAQGARSNQTGQETPRAQETEGAQEPEGVQEPGIQTPGTEREVGADDSADRDAPDPSAGAASAQHPSPSAQSDPGGSAPRSLDAARASLIRTVTNLAREAEATDDPRRARELLGAAREAASALEALRGS